MFLTDLAMEFSKKTGINKYALKLIESKQLLYRPIYVWSLVELETLKTYIKTYWKTGFIYSFKTLASAPILFDKKPDKSLQLCVDYWGLNSLTIKYQYWLPLIGELLDQLGWAKKFTQFDLTNAYHRMRIWEENIWKTIFQTRYRYFQYQVMPCELFNARASFQGYINKIPTVKLHIFVIIYLDDILVYAENLDLPHVDVVRLILKKIWKHRLFATLKKCRSYWDEVKFLGFVILA